MAVWWEGRHPRPTMGPVVACAIRVVKPLPWAATVVSMPTATCSQRAYLRRADRARPIEHELSTRRSFANHLHHHEGRQAGGPGTTKEVSVLGTVCDNLKKGMR